MNVIYRFSLTEAAKPEEKDFMQSISDIFSGIPEQILSYDAAEAELYEASYLYVENYVQKKQLPCACISLPLLRGFLAGGRDKNITFAKDEDKRLAYYQHAMSTARMLIDLQVPLSKREEDLVISAALLHVLKELISWSVSEEKMREITHLDPEIFYLISLITRDDASMTAADNDRFYERIMKNKLAFLIRIADRGNLVEQLYGISIWDAQSYVRETRKYFFPMCIYAKENYPDLYKMVTILMEKMRCLIEVTDILSTRYQTQEMALLKEILDLKEENARIRRSIRHLKEEMPK